MDVTRNRQLPRNVQVTPDRFLVFNVNSTHGIVRIDNFSWTTYDIKVKTPKWVECETRFILDAQSGTEIDLIANIIGDDANQSLSAVMTIVFTDMAEETKSYTTEIQLQYSPNLQKRVKQQSAVLLLQVSILLLLLSVSMLVFHYRFQMKYYLCVFQHAMCKTGRISDEPFINIKKIFRC